MMVKVIISFMLIFFLTGSTMFGVNAIMANNKRDCFVGLGWALVNAVLFVFVVILIPKLSGA